MDTLQAFLTVFAQPQLLLLVGLGTFAGVYVGAIPGLSVTMAVSILISFTFSNASASPSAAIRRPVSRYMRLAARNARAKHANVTADAAGKKA